MIVLVLFLLGIVFCIVIVGVGGGGLINTAAAEIIVASAAVQSGFVFVSRRPNIKPSGTQSMLER